MSTIKQVVEQSPQRICVLHGSHSGNTHRYAKYSHAELKWRLNIDAGSKSIASSDFKDSDTSGPNDTSLSLVSTYGAGEPNQATVPLWNELMAAEKLNLSYSVMARGSSLYDATFARAGITIDDRLNSVGAHRSAPLGIQDKMSLHGDDQYFGWKEGVVEALKSRNHFVERPFVYVPSPRPTWEIDYTKTEETAAQSLPRHAEHARPTPVKIDFLQKTDRQYLYAEFSLPPNETYRPGDYIVMWPTNSKPAVDQFIDAVFKTSERKHNLVHYRGHTTTYESSARHYLDIQGQPERELLLKLACMAPSATSAQEIRRLIESGDDIPSLSELLSSTGNGNPWIDSLPLPSTFFDLLPHLEPRRYSISSSPVESPHRAGISFVVEHDPKSGFWGTATGQMMRLAQAQESNELISDEIMISHEPLARFNPPESSATPLLLFGVGTGVAPFRGFVKDRFQQLHAGNMKPADCGRIILFSGTRTPDDLVHRSEFEQLSNTEDFAFTHLAAYSRFPQHKGPKYLADLIAQNRELIYEMIRDGAEIYVCGDIRKVRRSVRNGFCDILVEKEGLTPAEAKATWKAMSKANKIHLELW